MVLSEYIGILTRVGKFKTQTHSAFALIEHVWSHAISDLVAHEYNGRESVAKISQWVSLRANNTHVCCLCSW